MIVGDKFVYIHLQKTAGTFISSELLKAFPLSQSVGKKHANLSEINPENQGKILIGSIRHPIDFYVSLWKYGCEGKGGLYHRLVRSNSNISSAMKYLKSSKWADIQLKNVFKKNHPWKKYYSDNQNIEHFRKWFLAVNDAESILDIGSNPYDNTDLGLYSRRYLFQYFLFENTLKKKLSKISLNHTIEQTEVQIPTALRKMDFFIRQENLHSDLTHLIEKLQNIGESKNKDYSFNPNKVNTTENTQLKYVDYYTTELLELLKSKDRIIIEQHYSK